MGHRSDFVYGALELFGQMYFRSRWWLNVKNYDVLKDVEDMPWILLPRHQSFWDGWLVNWISGRKLYTFAKDTLPGKSLMIPGGMIPLKRKRDYPLESEEFYRLLHEHNDNQARYFGDLLAEGESGAIFPEGKRYDKMHDWHSHCIDRLVIATEQARSHGVEVAGIPVNMKFNRLFPYSPCGTVTAYIGKPFVGIGRDNAYLLEDHWKNEMELSNKLI